MRGALLTILIPLSLVACGTTPGAGSVGGGAGDALLDPGVDAVVDSVGAFGPGSEADAVVEPPEDLGGDSAGTTETSPDPDLADLPELDAGPGDPCVGPLRISPTSGPTTGGTVVEAVGIELYIGALDWWMQVGDDVWLSTIYGSGFPGPCTLRFMTLPHDEGSFPVWVFYGEPGWPPGPPDVQRTGTFTFIDTGETVGRGSCRSDDDCPDELEVCERGLGRCVRDRCLASLCSGDWSRGPCDPLEGCLAGDTPRCEGDDDCRLIYSSCSCQAVHADDPRDVLDDCAFDGCMGCGVNTCEGAETVAVCAEGRCTER